MQIELLKGEIEELLAHMEWSYIMLKDIWMLAKAYASDLTDEQREIVYEFVHYVLENEENYMIAELNEYVEKRIDETLEEIGKRPLTLDEARAVAKHFEKQNKTVLFRYPSHAVSDLRLATIELLEAMHERSPKDKTDVIELYIKTWSDAAEVIRKTRQKIDIDEPMYTSETGWWFGVGFGDLSDVPNDESLRRLILLKTLFDNGYVVVPLQYGSNELHSIWLKWVQD